MTDRDKKLIRNSTAEFLIFTGQAGEQSIEARYEDETIWLSQKLMATLFDVGVNTINYHLKEVFESGEVQPEATIRKFRIVQTEGSREVTRSVDFYNLDAIISVGYRVNSVRATQFRQWATQVLREFAIKGYVLDKKRMENGVFRQGSEQAAFRHPWPYRCRVDPAAGRQHQGQHGADLLGKGP